MGAFGGLRRALAIAAARLFVAIVVGGLLVRLAWGTQETPIRWIVDPGLEGVARALADDPWAFSPLPGIGDPRAMLTDTVRIWLVAGFEERDDLPLNRSEPWVAGVAIPPQNAILMRAGTGRSGLNSLRRLLRHELAHLALADATAGNAPVWVQEGYAQFAAGEWGVEEAWRLQLAFLNGEASLHDLALRFPRERTAASLAYLLSYTAVQELFDLSGEIGLRRTFERLAAGADLDTALRDVYGLTEAQFEVLWRRRVAGRYGWLYVLSRASIFWVALTIALLIFGWRRRRYNRLRWQALREAEAAEFQQAVEIVETVDAIERRRGESRHGER